MPNRRTRQHYTKEFKTDAVKLVLEHGYSGYEVARRLGIARCRRFTGSEQSPIYNL